MLRIYFTKMEYLCMHYNVWRQRHPVLMSHFMKVLERHDLGPTKTVDEVLLDQLQSAHQPHLTFADAVTYLPLQTHLDTFVPRELHPLHPSYR